jgi:phosphohistidine phosphatase
MRLFLIRHAIAEEPKAGLSDADRRLTPKGRERFAEAAQGIHAMGIHFQTILHSPKARAVETAAMLKAHCDGAIVETELLAAEPSGKLLAMFSQRTDVAAVGHQPYLSQLAAMLAFGERATGSELAIKKGGMVVMEGEAKPGGMQILGVYEPGDLRLMGGGKARRDSQRP